MRPSHLLSAAAAVAAARAQQYYGMAPPMSEYGKPMPYIP